MTFVSYAQNLEDVMLWRALKHIEQGFYVDVGANDPKVLSVTRAFYERGWHGINIDPATYELLSRERIKDVNLEVAVGTTEGEVTFYEISNSALSTCDHEIADRYRQDGYTVLERKVPSSTLNRILTAYAENPIHFMNIDVEGAELEVLQGLDLSLWRPWIILIEATIPTTTTLVFENWENLLISSNYQFVYFDGLNRFYVAKEHWELADAFQLPPNIFDQYVLSREIDNQLEFQKELEAKEEVIQLQNRELETKNKGLETQNKELEAKNKELEAKNRELEAKEMMIQEFKNSNFFWLVNGPLRHIPLLVYIFRLLRDIRLKFLSKLGVLVQYQPKRLVVPPAYVNTPLPSPNVPGISIVTPSYNQARFIQRTIRSVFDQGYPNLEYVIQDGNSTDETLNILAQYSHQLTHLEAREDDGQAQAINLGFQHTNGEIMAYLNSDDVFLPGALNYVANYFQLNPEVDVIYSHRIIIDENDQEIGRWIMPPHDNQILYWTDYVPQETLFWRRRIWDRAGGYVDETYKFALDWDLLLRFQQNGAVIRRIPRFLAAFRVHNSQKTSTHYKEIGKKEIQRIHQKYLGRNVTDKEIGKHIQAYLRISMLYHQLYRLKLLRV